MSEILPQATERVVARYEMPDPLRDDIRLLGGLLGTILKEAGGQSLLDDVEHLRELTIKRSATTTPRPSTPPPPTSTP